MKSPSFPRKREPSVVRHKSLDPRVRGDDRQRIFIHDVVAPGAEMRSGRPPLNAVRHSDFR